MKFLCLCHYSLPQFADFTPDDFQRMGALCAPHDQALRASGRVIAIGSMATPDQFRTLRARKDSPVEEVAGPYAPTAEPFGAFFIIEAADMDDAVRVARLHPGTHLGSLCDGGIEIRPLEMLDVTPQ